MDISENSIERLKKFIQKIQGQAYPEKPSYTHSNITQQMLEHFFKKYSLPQNSMVLDVGCGQGPALDLFKKKGYRAIGITINDEDIHACKQKGHEILKMDQSFLDFPDKFFDFIWARHVLEHSIFPFFTLSEFYRVLKPEGFLYVEVPAPGTACHHETNQNHYSVLTANSWASLIVRAEFILLENLKLNFDVPAGPDEYWAFICQKPLNKNPSA